MKTTEIINLPLVLLLIALYPSYPLFAKRQLSDLFLLLGGKLFVGLCGDKTKQLGSTVGAGFCAYIDATVLM
jgi:hypothetical protein